MEIGIKINTRAQQFSTAIKRAMSWEIKASAVDYLSSHETSLDQSTEVNHIMYDKGFSPSYGKKCKQILIFTEGDLISFLYFITLTNNTNIQGMKFIKEVTA